MLDVGYNIDGKHGVIRNVAPLLNTTTEHLCFQTIDGYEQYALKKENIDYVIPHQEEIHNIEECNGINDNDWGD